MEATSTWSNAGAAAAGAVRRSLDDLAAMSGAELGELYREGTTPTDLHVLDGRPRGRMLAVRGADRGALFDGLRRFAGSVAFPWGGKSFFPVDASRGRGINRVRLGGKRFDWFPFETRVEPSVVDGAPCIYLDYEQPGNPIFIRKIRDEIREIAPRLFMGPAMWKDGRGGAVHVLWFALDFSDEEPAF
jgi:hypothetical protein